MKTPPLSVPTPSLSEQKRNTSLTYSNSLRELLQRKISTLEQQLHHDHADPDGPEHHGEEHGHGNEKEHHHHHGDEDEDDIEHRSDEHESDRKEGHDGGAHQDHQDQSRHLDHHEGDGEHGNEAEGHGLVSHAGYRVPGKTGFHSAKLESMLNQLHLAGKPTHLPGETAAK